MSIPISVLYLMIPLVLGIISGYLLRNKKQVRLEKVSLAIIVVLIFALGFGIGANNELLTAMPQVGFQSLVISVLAILFSIAFVIAGRRLVKR
ncbi:MAG TPA: LysO family transporter [Candidatus Bathyarchaeia archaeon]|nr:LysO family transporter [Candidatus Bathyarchaeia archaeon]